jgi:hypothetical protein
MESQPRAPRHPSGKDWLIQWGEEGENQPAGKPRLGYVARDWHTFPGMKGLDAGGAAEGPAGGEGNHRLPSGRTGTS